LTSTRGAWGTSVAGVNMKRSRYVALFVAGWIGALGSPSLAEAGAQPVTHEDFDASNFSHGSKIDNRFLPLSPGTQLTLEGTVNVGGAPAVHRVVFTVTDLTKEVDGVRSRVIYDVDSTDGVVAEAELAFMAQDDGGNVWNTGEYPEVFQDGVFVGAPATWIAGVEDALAGVGMRVRPRPGTSDYFQGLIPSIEFADLASIVGFVPELCVPAGCFRNVLEIQETNTFHPDEGFQLKYYAPRVGNIRIDFLGGAEQETLALVKRTKLGEDGLEKANHAALRLDRRAYRVAPEIYGSTPRAVEDPER
jgi:hypothetical protein